MTLAKSVLPVLPSFQVYIQYMKFARRAEGIKSARAVFKLARENARCTYHVFIAAALMEYYCSKVNTQLIAVDVCIQTKM